MLLYSQNPHSQGAKRLARELGIRRIRHHNSRFSGRRRPWVINWGASAIPLPWRERVRLLNAPEAIKRVSNKLDFFWLMLATDLCPPIGTSRDEAERMIERGHKVVCRTILNGHGGIGIVIASTIEELVNAPLYVQYIPKKSEYRVHIFDGEIIDIQKKIRKPGVEPLDWRVRSHDNGFIYVREHIDVPWQVMHNALHSMQLTELHFGAADVIYNERRDRVYVLEINTAPGIEGQTVISYANAIKEFTGE